MNRAALFDQVQSNVGQDEAVVHVGCMCVVRELSVAETFGVVVKSVWVARLVSMACRGGSRTAPTGIEH